MNTNKIFNITSPAEFDTVTLEIFNFQYQNNIVYRTFCNYLKRTDLTVKTILDIPFLPIEFFKSKKILSNKDAPKKTFTSSGTTGSITSKHHITNIKIYENSYLKGFHHFYGDITKYCVLALLPSYLEREGSSLIYMVDDLIKKSNHIHSGFYLHNTTELKEKLELLDSQNTKILLIGVSFALLDFVEKHALQLENTIIMETGGMKGKRKELIREELHAILKNGFNVDVIHSEYGMTELLSQAYSVGNGLFKTPPWMKVLTRDTEDPLTLQSIGKTGGLNIIDLANINSCSFIATQDLGRVYADNRFEILGRFDNTDIRGCNLMVL
ncbi:MAG: acyl transferase [Cellulophaga sp.]